MMVQRPVARGYEVCVQYRHVDGPGSPMPLYHGPPPDPALGHPFFPGTVLYVGPTCVAQVLRWVSQEDTRGELDA